MRTIIEGCAIATVDAAGTEHRDGHEPGKLADVALWRLDGLDHAGIEDPVAALVFGAPRPVELLLIGGGSIVRDGELRTVGEERLAQDLKRASRKLNRVEATR
jgi:cytosine/adenosine deaminase-related metal-dependent hydrolase